MTTRRAASIPDAAGAIIDLVGASTPKEGNGSPFCSRYSVTFRVFSEMMVLSSAISSEVTDAIVEICAIQSGSQCGNHKKKKTTRDNYRGKAVIYGPCLVRRPAEALRIT